jgi:hypothetical protein
MGKVLQIQVRAWTYDEDEVIKTWPKLTSLVWPEHDRWAPVGSKHGVMELVQTMPDVLRFGDWPESTRKALQEGIEQAAAIGKKLEAALADWQPVEANRLSMELEEMLSALERSVLLQMKTDV